MFVTALALDAKAKRPTELSRFGTALSAHLDCDLYGGHNSDMVPCDLLR